MYAGGPLWKPPILPFSQYGMPPSDDEDDFVDESREKRKEKTPFLPIGSAISQFDDRHEENGDEEELPIASKWVSQVGKDDKDGKQEKRMPSGYRNEFDSALHSLSPVRDLVGDLMALCLEQVEFAEEIVDAIVESLLHQEQASHSWLSYHLQCTIIKLGATFYFQCPRFFSSSYDFLGPVHFAE